MNYRKFANTRGRFYTCPGTNIHIVFSPEIQKDGSIILVEIGKEDTDEIIQSYADSVSLEAILARFVNGDVSALNRYQPIYADMTNAPKNLAESLQLFINAEKAFNALPADVKKEFNNSYTEWIFSSQNPEWAEKMSSVIYKNESYVNADKTEEEVSVAAD